jgi:hypothetical protein
LAYGWWRGEKENLSELFVLFYGLEEADGRTLSRTEIAAHLSRAPGAVKGAIRRALRKLRAAPKEPPPRQEPRDKEAERQAQRAAQEVSLDQAYARLEAQGLPITVLTLALEAQVGTSAANAYLCRRWGTVPQRLERAYAELLQGAFLQGSISGGQRARTW